MPFVDPKKHYARYKPEFEHALIATLSRACCSAFAELSIETTLMHPRRGFIKLEDTVAVTETGWDAFGDKGRGWNCGDPPMMSPGPDQQQ